MQAALCAAQCSFWHSLLQYSTLLHALHLLRPPLGQPGHAQRRRSRASDAPALELEEAALIVAPLSAEQAESVTGCGEIDMAEVSAKSSFTARSSLSRSARSATSAVMAAASARVAPSRQSRLLAVVSQREPRRTLCLRELELLEPLPAQEPREGVAHPSTAHERVKAAEQDLAHDELAGLCEVKRKSW